MKASKVSIIVPYLLILSTSILSSQFSFGQYKFESTYGGTNSDRGRVMSLTNDGGYIICGSTSSFSSNQDFYLIKIDQFSNILWSKVYLSPGNIDGFYGVKQAPSGDYYLGGYIEGGFGFLDDLVMKVDSVGNVIWTKIFGGIEADELRDLNITPDGGVLVSGQNASFGAGLKEIQAIKFLGNGNIEWAKAYGNIWEEFGAKNLLLSDGNYLFVGATDISGFYDVRPLLIKTDTSGVIIWAKVYSGFVEDWARSGVQLSDGFIIVGDTRSFGLGGSEDIYLIKTNVSGDVQWAKAYGGIESEKGYGVIQDIEGNFIVTGFTNSFGLGNYDAFLMKTDQNGIPEWFYTYGGSSNDYAFNVLQTPDSGYVMTGGRSSESLGGEDMVLIKTDKEGKSTCENGPFNINVFNVANLLATDYMLITSDVISVSDLTLATLTPNSAQNFICGVIPVELSSFTFSIDRVNVELSWSTATETNNQGFKILKDVEEIGYVPGSGTTTEFREYSYVDKNVLSGTYLYSLLQIDYDGTIENIGEVEVIVEYIPTEYSISQNYPNPFNPSTTISYTIPKNSYVQLAVYNALGEVVKELLNEEKSAGSYDAEFIAEGLPSGIYYYRLVAGEFVETKKMILMK